MSGIVRATTYLSEDDARALLDLADRAHGVDYLLFSDAETAALGSLRVALERALGDVRG